MRSYLDLSIRHKLQGIALLTSGVALLIASAVFTLYDRQTFLREKAEDLSVSAQMIGSNSTAALSFGDAKSAQEILAALHAKTECGQCLHLLQGWQSPCEVHPRGTAWEFFSSSSSRGMGARWSPRI